MQVHTSGDEVELFLNGQSLGRKTKARYQYRLQWNNVIYTPGELKAVAYKNGKEWATDTVKTTGPAATLHLSADRSVIRADGDDLSFITVRVADQDGRTVPHSHPAIRFRVDGPGEIVATDNGDATDFTPFQSHERQAFNGLALVIIRAKHSRPGTLTVRAESAGLTSAPVSITTHTVPASEH